MAPPPPPTAISTVDAGDPPSPTSDHYHQQEQMHKASTQPAPLNQAWTAWSSSLTSRALDPLAAAASDLADFASRHRQAALTATSDVQLAKIHAQAEQCATQALLTISEYLNRAATALDTGTNTCASELHVLSATLAAIEQRVSEMFAVSAIQSVGGDTLHELLHGDMHEKTYVDFTAEEAVRVIKQPNVSSAASTKSGRSNSHVPGLAFQSHGSSSAANASTAAASTSYIPTIPKLDLNSLDALGTPLPDLSTITTKAGSIKQQSLLSMTSNSPPPSGSGGSTTVASNNLDLSMLGDVSQHTTIRRKNSTMSTTTGATTTTTDSSAPNNPGLSSMVGASIDDLAPPPPPPPGAPPMASPSPSPPPPPPPAADAFGIPTQQFQPAAADPRGSVRSISGMIPTQQPPAQPQSMAGGSVRSVHGISAPVPLYASHQPPPPQQQYQQQQQQQQQYNNMQYANAQRVPSPGSHMGTYTGGGSMRGGQPIGLGTGVNGGYGVPPMPLAPAQYTAAVIPPRTQSAQGMAYATSAVPGYQPGANGSIGYGYAGHQQQQAQQMGYPMQQHVQQGGPGSAYASVNQLPPPPQMHQYAVDPATGAQMYYGPGSGAGSNSASPQLAPAPPPPMGMSPPPPQVVMARVLYPYTASEQDEMHLMAGEMIEVHVVDAGAGWARGVSVADRRRAGMFPRSYVQLM